MPRTQGLKWLETASMTAGRPSFLLERVVGSGFDSTEYVCWAKIILTLEKWLKADAIM